MYLIIITTFLNWYKLFSLYSPKRNTELDILNSHGVGFYVHYELPKLSRQAIAKIQTISEMARIVKHLLYNQKALYCTSLTFIEVIELIIYWTNVYLISRTLEHRHVNIYQPSILPLHNQVATLLQQQDEKINKYHITYSHINPDEIWIQPWLNFIKLTINIFWTQKIKPWLQLTSTN